MEEKQFWDLFEKNPVIAMEKIIKETEILKQSEQEAQEIIAELKAENTRLKEENYTLKSGFDFQIRINEKINKKYVKILKYKTCLQEIKEIAERELSLTDEDDELWEVFSEILQKIAQASRVRSVGVGLREQDEQDTETRLMRAQQDAECEVSE